MNKKEEKIWELAHKSWENISNDIGFETREIAYLQGFFVGFKKASKTNITEEEFRNMFKALCKDAYHAKSAGDMWEADEYRTWYEKFFS